MTYARSRLWLGISGVGTLVLLALLILLSGITYSLLPTSSEWTFSDAAYLFGVLGGFTLVMIPFDLLGGYILPRKFGRSSDDPITFLIRWFSGVLLQSTLFFLTAIGILAVGRAIGLLGVIVFISGLAIFYAALQGWLIRWIATSYQKTHCKDLQSLMDSLESSDLKSKPIVVLPHNDPGFTGGIIGLPGNETIVLPSNWLRILTLSQLAAVVNRRNIAISSGSRTTGLLLAIAWVVIGFCLSSLLPGAGVTSVAELTNTFCGFTMWTFLGLLVLPSVSRHASFVIDRKVVESGISATQLDETIAALDKLQDDEPERSAFIEMIFHPVPSSSNRQSINERKLAFGAWHVARTVLFLSWSCVGFLSRAVHCNAGRPELWIMPPCD